MQVPGAAYVVLMLAVQDAAVASTSGHLPLHHWYYPDRPCTRLSVSFSTGVRV